MSKDFHIDIIIPESGDADSDDRFLPCNDHFSLNQWPDWFPIHKIEELEKLAAVGYTPKKIALYFGIREDVFMQHWMDENSPIRYYFERGILVNEAKEAIAMQTAANTGNTTQGQRLDKRRYEINFQNLKERICYGKG